MGWNIILILVFLFVFTTERHQKTLLFDAVRYWIISYQHSKSNIIMRLATMIYNTYIEAGAQGEGEMLKK